MRFKASSYKISTGGVTLAMNPMPGVTGMESALARVSRNGAVAIEWNPMPGAEQGRAAMFAAVRAAGAIAIAETIALPATAADRASLESQMVRATSSPAARQDAFDAYKDSNGTLTFTSIHACCVQLAFGDGSVRSIRQGLWNRILVAMQLGVYNERWDKLPGVTQAEINGTAPVRQNVFSFPNMRELTNSFVPDPKAAQSLLELVSKAEAAAKAGDVPAAQAASKAYADAIVSGAALRSPIVSPVGAQVFVGGWGSSIYQYAFNDPRP